MASYCVVALSDTNADYMIVYINNLDIMLEIEFLVRGAQELLDFMIIVCVVINLTIYPDTLIKVVRCAWVKNEGLELGLSHVKAWRICIFPMGYVVYFSNHRILINNLCRIRNLRMYP